MSFLRSRISQFDDALVIALPAGDSASSCLLHFESFWLFGAAFPNPWRRERRHGSGYVWCLIGADSCDDDTVRISTYGVLFALWFG
eukprot:c47760_g1_i1 orf=122-379(+)